MRIEIEITAAGSDPTIKEIVESYLDFLVDSLIESDFQDVSANLTYHEFYPDDKSIRL